MRNRAFTLACCLATALAFGTGCKSTPRAADPTTAYEADDVIVSGVPPLACGITKPVIVSVIDETSRSRVFYLDASDEDFQGLLKFDVDKQALILTSGEAQSEISLLKIDPKHRYTVVFNEPDCDCDHDDDHEDEDDKSHHPTSDGHGTSGKIIAPVTKPTEASRTEGVGRDIEAAGDALRDAAHYPK